MLLRPFSRLVQSKPSFLPTSSSSAASFLTASQSFFSATSSSSSSSAAASCFIKPSFSASSSSFSSLPLRSFHTSSSLFVAHGHAQAEPVPEYPVLFLTMSGDRFEVFAREGETLLECAVRNRLPIPGSCGGGGMSEEEFGEGAMCRNCHIYVDNQHLAELPPKSFNEERLTEWIKNKNANSRFACEIVVGPQTAYMTCIIPEYVDRA